MSDATTTPSEGHTALGQCLGHFCTTERASFLARLRKMEEALRKARVAIATWSPDPTEPLEEIDAALKAE